MPKDREQSTATLTGTFIFFLITFGFSFLCFSSTPTICFIIFFKGARLFLFGGKDKTQQIIDDFSMLNTGINYFNASKIRKAI